LSHSWRKPFLFVSSSITSSTIIVAAVDAICAAFAL
jgi:hypothetical protein